MVTPLNRPQVLFIGIAGSSGCGKTTYAKHLVNYLRSPLKPIASDDFYIRGIPINHPVLGYVMNEEDPKTLDVQKLLTLLQKIKYEPEKRTKYHRSDVPINDQKQIFVVVEGFLLFALCDELTNMFDIRIFLESTQCQCRMNRYRRHYPMRDNISDEQIQIPNDFQQWFDHLVWAEYLKQRNLQLSKAEAVFQYEQYQHHQYAELDNYIDTRLKELVNKQE